MKLLLKVVSFLLFFCLLIGVSNVNAIKSTIYKDFVSSKNVLSKTVKGKRYIYQVDNIIKKVGNNKKTLEKVYIKVKELKVKFENSNSENDKMIKNIVGYLYGKILISIEILDKEEIIKEVKKESIDNGNSLGVTEANVKNHNINEDNIISYIKIEDGKLKFDLISGDNIKYGIYLGNSYFYASNNDIIGIYGIIDASRYVGTTQKIQIQAFRDNKYITNKIIESLYIDESLKLKIEEKSEDNTFDNSSKGNNELHSYKLDVDKNQFMVGEPVDVNLKGINKDGSIHVERESYDGVLRIYSTTDKNVKFSNYAQSGYIRGLSLNKKVEYTFNDIASFSKPGIHKLKICRADNNLICGTVIFNVVEEIKEVFSDYKIIYDGKNIISWDKDKNVDGYILRIKGLKNIERGTVEKPLGTFTLDKDENFYNLTPNLYWEDLLFTVIGFKGKFGDLGYKELGQGTIQLDYFHEKSDLSEIKKDCSGTIDGIDYKIADCNIEKTITDGSGDTEFIVKLTPSNLNEYYSYSTSSFGFPQYSIKGGGSGATKGILEIPLVIKDDRFYKGEYVGYISVYIYDKDPNSPGKIELKLGLKLTIK